jgi:predicted DsbA family dithiol-disulfide isomerase
MENENITADMVELTEFPQLAQKYHVMGVPKTIINETHGVDGAVPESALVDMVLEAIGE